MLQVLLGLVFIALPLIELALLIKAGQLIGLWATLAIVVGTGLLGVHVLLRQSWTAMRQMREGLARGQAPVASVIDGAFLLVAGSLLITPGLLSDTVALLLLVPPIRHAVAGWLVRRLLGRAQANVFGSATQGPRAQPPHSARGEGPIIEGEFERLDEKATGPHRPNGRDHV